MKYSWSSYFQNSLQIEASRLMILNENTRDRLKEWLPVRENLRILDVGCGNGVFTVFLGNCLTSCEITGIDVDEAFIRDAEKRVPNDGNNIYVFKCGDGLNLPFQDGTFDVVISNTYLTSVPNPRRALEEKIRVAKRGGYVVSITGQSLTNHIFSMGNYPPDRMEALWKIHGLQEKMNRLYQNMVRQDAFIQPRIAEKVPQLFGSSGLRNIYMRPLGIAFSLSDITVPNDVKKQFITAFYNGEMVKLKKYMELPGAEAYLSSNEVIEYTDLIKEHQEYLINSLGENTIWEWYGGTNTLMAGQKPEC